MFKIQISIFPGRLKHIWHRENRFVKNASQRTVKILIVPFLSFESGVFLYFVHSLLQPESLLLSMGLLTMLKFTQNIFAHTFNFLSNISTVYWFDKTLKFEILCNSQTLKLFIPLFYLYHIYIPVHLGSSLIIILIEYYILTLMESLTANVNQWQRWRFQLHFVTHN